MNTHRSTSTQAILERNNVNVLGEGHRPMLFAHGFGCDQNMWRFVYPAFRADYRIVLFDYVGAGKSDLSAYSSVRYGSLAGYAQDILDVCDALQLKDVVLVGHSVSSMIGVLAAIQRPELFHSLVLVAPSPRYIDDPTTGYVGGFSEKDIAELLESLDDNYLGWSRAIAPVIMGESEPALTEELANSFCRTDPAIAKEFAHVTFLADNRADLPRVRIPSLVLQCSVDAIAPVAVGEYVHRAMPSSTLSVLDAHGHCPHLTEPGQVVDAIKSFLGRR